MQHLPDPYRVLGVQRAATAAQIKTAHRSLAKRYHPDAPEGDTARFLAVQEAYALLSDPLRRRDWDARHAPGPMRAGEGTTRGRGRAAAGRWTREDPDVGARRAARPPRRAPGPGAGPRDAPGTGSDAPPGARAAGGRSGRPDGSAWEPGRDPGSRTYTWSAEGVPWWEDFGGARRTRSDPKSQRRDDEEPVRDRPRASDGASDGGRDGPGDRAGGGHDVYSRSSGAAWSSAARRYFRQADSDLPSRGVFQREGSGYVTGARAREAAARPPGPPRPDAGPPRPGPGAPRPDILRRSDPAGPAGPARPARTPTPRQAFHHEPAPRQDPERREWKPAPTPPGAPTPAAAAPGGNVTGDARAGVLSGRRASLARVRGRTPSTPPDVASRVGVLAIAWLPLAAGIGYGAPAALGCAPAAGTCPDGLPALQAVLAALVLALFVAFPAIARVGALATVGALAAAVPMFVVMVLAGVWPPAPPIILAAGTVIALVYLLSGALAARSTVRQSP